MLLRSYSENKNKKFQIQGGRMSPAPPLYPLLTVFRVISSSFRVYSPLQANNVQTYRHTNVYIDIQIFSGLFSYTCKQYSWTYRHTNIYIDIQIFPVIFSYTCKQYSDIQTYIQSVPYHIRLSPIFNAKIRT